jgi:hypothetical protein
VIDGCSLRKIVLTNKKRSVCINPERRTYLTSIFTSSFWGGSHGFAICVDVEGKLLISIASGVTEVDISPKICSV